MNIHRLRKWLVLYWLLITGMNLAAQPAVQAFIFPDKNKPDQWRVDLYVQLPQEMVYQLEKTGENSLNLKLKIYDEKGNGLLDLNHFLDITRNQNDFLFSNEIPGIERGFSFPVSPGNYRMELILFDSSGNEIGNFNHDLTIAEQRSSIKISDLVPVSFPRLTLPPFERILWPEVTAINDNFYLYYEVVTSMPDTLLQMEARLENEQGEVIRQDTYSLIVSNHWKRDYFWVKVDGLTSGTYILKIILKDIPLTKEFKFRVVNSPFELTGRGEAEVS